MKKIVHGLFLLLLGGVVVFPVGANAATQIWCQGTISRVIVYSDDSVMFLPSWRGDFVEACSLAGTWKGIDPITCSVWYSILMEAYRDQKPTTVYYANTNSTCPTIPYYGSADPPGYIMVN